MDIKEILDLINDLEKEHADAGQGARDALEAILNARMLEKMGGMGGEMPDEIEIDPDLDKPEVDVESEPDDTYYDDPDDLLDKEETDDEDDADYTEDDKDSDDSDSEDEDDLDIDDETGKDDSEDLDNSEDGDSEDDEDDTDEEGSKKDTKDDSEKTTKKDTSEDDSDDSDSRDDNESDSETPPPGTPGKDKKPKEADTPIDLGPKADKKDTDDDDTPDEPDEDGEADEESVVPELEDEEEKEIDDSDGVDVDDGFSEDEAKDKEHRRQLGEANAIKTQAKQVLRDKADELSAEQKEKLEEIIKTMDDLLNSDEPLDPDEFNEKINDALDILDKIVDIIYLSEEENEERLADIEREIMDPIYADELDQEDEVNKAEDPLAKKLKTRDAEKEKIKKLYDKEASVASGSLAQFKADLKKAIGEQISDWQDVEEPTYSMPDRHHEDDGIVAPATRIDELPLEDKPSVDVYIDQSGSWTNADVEIALEAVAELLKFEEQELLNLNIFYFSQYLTTDRAYARAHGWYECWDLIRDQINAKPKTKNVVMITDSDIGHNWGVEGCHGCKVGPSTQVEGCVWFLWKNGSREPMAPVKLRGKQGTFQYQFRSR